MFDYVYNFTVKKVTGDIETLNLNTAISQMMIFVNECYKTAVLPKDYAIGFVKMLSCFAPHIGNEMYEILGAEDELAYAAWPTYDESKLVLEKIEIVVQVNGKVRAKFMERPDLSDDELYELALAQENIQKQLEGKTIRKHFVIKGKMVNIVAN